MKKFLMGSLLAGLLLTSSVFAAPQWGPSVDQEVLTPGAYSLPVIGSMSPKGKLPVMPPGANGYVLSITSPVKLFFAVYDGSPAAGTETPTFSTATYKFLNRTTRDVTVSVESVTDNSQGTDKYELVGVTPTAADKIKLSVSPTAHADFTNTNKVILGTTMIASNLGEIAQSDGITAKEASFALEAELHSTLPSKVLSGEHTAVFKFVAK